MTKPFYIKAIVSLVSFMVMRLSFAFLTTFFAILGSYYFSFVYAMDKSNAGMPLHQNILALVSFIVIFSTAGPAIGGLIFKFLSVARVEFFVVIVSLINPSAISASAVAAIKAAFIERRDWFFSLAFDADKRKDGVWHDALLHRALCLASVRSTRIGAFPIVAQEIF